MAILSLSDSTQFQESVVCCGSFMPLAINYVTRACEELLQTEHLAGFNSRNNAMHLPQLDSLCS